MAAAVAVTVDPVTSDGDIDVDIDIDGDGDVDVDSLQNDTDVCPSPTEVDNLLSKEFLQLSLRDRNAISEEIHGVLTLAPKESPQLLDAALVQLSEEIDLIPDNSPIKAAYLKSQQQVCLQEELEFPNNKNKNTYVNDRNFRLRFVRCELFDAKKAAIRMLKFLDIASDIFGEIVLKRPIHLADFTKEELKIMRFGVIQILPYRDRSGRPIFAWVGDFGLENANNRLRVRTVQYSILYYISYIMLCSIQYNIISTVVCDVSTSTLLLCVCASKTRTFLNANKKKKQADFEYVICFLLLTFLCCFDLSLSLSLIKSCTVGKNVSLYLLLIIGRFRKSKKRLYNCDFCRVQ